MFNRPSDLPSERERTATEDLEQLEDRIENDIQTLLDRLPFQPLAAHLEQTAFSENELFPKRSQRPTVKIEYLVDRLARSEELPESTRRRLVRFSVGVQEYYDIFDDLVDGDVSSGNEAEAIITLQLLFPLLVEELDELGSPATTFWTERATALMEAPLIETLSEPEPETYREVVRRQGDLFGFVTGMPFVIADCERERIETAERLGQAFFTHEQFLLDGEQYAGEDTDPWNAWALFGEREALETVEDCRREFEQLARQLAPQQARAIEVLVAVDVPVWLRNQGLNPD